MWSDKVIWIVEDDPSCRFVYEEILGIRHTVHFFGSVAELEEAIGSQTHPDLLIADVRLPGESFLTLLARLGSRFLELVPIVVVSSVDDLDALRFCFEKGALDYITKPFGKSELVVKVERILGGNNVRKQSPLVSIDVDPTTLTVSRGEKVSKPLTSREFQIISLLNKSPGGSLSKPALLNGVWGNVAVASKTLDVHLSNLRKKCQSVGVFIRHSSPDSLSLESTR